MEDNLKRMCGDIGKRDSGRQFIILYWKNYPRPFYTEKSNTDGI